MNTSRSRPSLSNNDAQSLPLAEELNTIARLAMVSGRQFSELQSVTVDWLLVELAAVREGFLAMGETKRWPAIDFSGTQRNIEFARACWEVATKTQGAMLGAMREGISQRGSALAASRPRQSGATQERRIRATVIKFPDRRRG